MSMYGVVLGQYEIVNSSPAGELLPTAFIGLCNSSDLADLVSEEATSSNPAVAAALSLFSTDSAVARYLEAHPPSVTSWFVNLDGYLPDDEIVHLLFSGQLRGVLRAVDLSQLTPFQLLPVHVGFGKSIIGAALGLGDIAYDARIPILRDTDQLQTLSVNQ